MNLHITLEMMRSKLTVPLLCDALDGLGLPRQSPRLPLKPLTTPLGKPPQILMGFCKNTLWADMAHVDPNPYALELAAVDSCKPNDVIICAARGSMRSGIWGELLSTAARNRGCAGVVVEGAVRDISKMRVMEFPVYALGSNPLDSRNRQRVVDYDVVIELDGVRIEPGDLIAVDEDGIVIVPKHCMQETVEAAWNKAFAEDEVRASIAQGMLATEAFHKYGVL